MCKNIVVLARAAAIFIAVIISYFVVMYVLANLLVLGLIAIPTYL